jgi:hypothetical protein
MIIWSGLGFLVALIGGGCLVAIDALTRTLYGDKEFFAAHGWPKLLAFAVAAVITWFLGRFLHRNPGKRHSLFFIPMEYWGPIFVVAGVVFMFVNVK